MKGRYVTTGAWSPDQLAHFLDVTASDRLAGLWHLAVMTGMRRGDCLGLSWKDVNLDEGVLSVRQAWVMIGGSPQLPEQKSKRPQLTFHGLRHNHASALLVVGEHVKVVSERLGHHSSGDVYSSVVKGMQRDAVERLASIVTPNR